METWIIYVATAVVILILTAEELDLAAAGTVVDMDLQSTGQQIGQISQHPAGLAQLQLFLPGIF